MKSINLSNFKVLFKDLGLNISRGNWFPLYYDTVSAYHVNTVGKTSSVPEDKFQEFKDLCSHWAFKTYCTKGDLQISLDSLLYITRFVKSSLKFVKSFEYCKCLETMLI